MSLLRILANRFRKRPTEKDISNALIERIRNGGGEVGENVDILSSNIDMGEPYLIKIGNNVTLTGIKVLTHDACLFKTTGYTRVGKVHIGSDVFVGWGSIILPNVSIGDRVVIGAGSVVAKDIPGNSVAVGNPCRVIGTYDELVAKNLEAMKSGVVSEKTPPEIMEDPELIAKYVEAGKGYIK
jgi:maltose O-acetyltransferase